MPSTAIKRLADESSELGHKAQKLSHKSTPGGASARTKEKERQIVSRSQIKETDHQEGVCVQVGKYLFEQFSIPAIRPHATVGLADRNRIQFYHPNHSVILISSAINFGPIDEADGLDKLIAIVIAFPHATTVPPAASTAVSSSRTSGSCLRQAKTLVFYGPRRTTNWDSKRVGSR